MSEDIVKLRPEQEEILKYRMGNMGISAVPGSGKTWTLSLLAAEIIKSNLLEDDQEVLVVTMVNSAVDNFHQRIQRFSKKKGVLPFWGYRVRTLHGLAHDIVRERPELVGLPEDFSIVDEQESRLIVAEGVRTWIHSNPEEVENILKSDLEPSQVYRVKNRKLPEALLEIGSGFIRLAKDKRLSPEQIQAKLESLQIPMNLVEMGNEIYADYQRSLSYRGAVDFDDLISYALLALESDNNLLERLQYRWPYILEDEAQDSSRLQEAILELLSGNDGNWVRVGDPNQAIFETFTTANPKFLREFLQQKHVRDMQLSISGRSTRSIFDLANHLVEWTHDNHPIKEVRESLNYPPLIHPTAEVDPNPNPQDEPSSIFLILKKYSSDAEISAVADSLSKWLPSHPDDTVAVLVPQNKRGSDLALELKRRNLKFSDTLLKVTSQTRITAGVIGSLLNYLSTPQSSRKLVKVYEHWLSLQPECDKSAAKVSIEFLRKIRRIEDYLTPEPGNDWLEKIKTDIKNITVYQLLRKFRDSILLWQSTVTIPIDQMLITIAQDLFTKPEDLALAHKLALILRQASRSHPEWKLEEFSNEIELISKNKRRFLGLSNADTGFDPERFKGEVVISTMHKAKGLEWDRVYLMSVNDYDFPSGFSGENYIAEKWFVRNNLNLLAETLAQFENVISLDEYKWYKEGDATLEARIEYVRERLRLLYVGITRARKELVITWNSGRSGKSNPAVSLIELAQYWNEKKILSVADAKAE